MKILLDYLFPITAIEPTAAASTAFLKQVCVVATPKSGQEANVGNMYECSDMDEVADRTDNTNAQQLFNAGMSKVFILLMDDLELDDAMEENANEFFTVLISDDFDDADITLAKATGTITITSYANLVSGTDDVVTVAGQAFTAQTGAATLGAATFQAATSNNATADSLAAQINAHAVTSALVTATALAGVVTIQAIESGHAGNSIALAYTDNDTNVGATKSGTALANGTGLTVGAFDGVVGVSSDDDATFLPAQAAIAKRCAFFVSSDNGAKNMFYAFGKLLSNALNWRNQQYVTMPVDDEVASLGDAEALFDDRISFVISDDEFSTRLAFFAAGGKAIVAPYISKNLQIDLQSTALTYISANQPGYTKVQAALLEDELQKMIQEDYIDTQWIEDGIVEIDLAEDNFVAAGNINIAEPKALWRVFGEMRQTL